MNRWVYNICMLLGLMMLGVGVGVQFGIGFGLAVAGAVLIGLTFAGALIASRGREG